MSQITMNNLLGAVAQLETMRGAKPMEDGHYKAWLAALQDPLTEGDTPPTPAELELAVKDTMKHEQFWPGLSGLVTALRRVRLAERAKQAPRLTGEQIAEREESARHYREIKSELQDWLRQNTEPRPSDPKERIEWAVRTNRVLAANENPLSAWTGLNLSLRAVHDQGINVEVYGWWLGRAPSVLEAVTL